MFFVVSIGNMEVGEGTKELDYPEITQENVEQFENFYFFHHSKLNLEDEKNPDRKLVIATQMGQAQLELKRDYLRGKRIRGETGVELDVIFWAKVNGFREKIRTGEVRAVQPDHPRAAQYLAVGDLSGRIEKFWKTQTQKTP